MCWRSLCPGWPRLGARARRSGLLRLGRGARPCPGVGPRTPPWPDSRNRNLQRRRQDRIRGRGLRQSVLPRRDRLARVLSIIASVLLAVLPTTARQQWHGACLEKEYGTGPKSTGWSQQGRTMENQDGTRCTPSLASSPAWVSMQASAVDRSDEYQGGAGRPTRPTVAAVLRRNLERSSRPGAQPREIPIQGRGAGSGALLRLARTALHRGLPSRRSSELRVRQQRTTTPQDHENAWECPQRET